MLFVNRSREIVQSLSAYSPPEKWVYAALAAGVFVGIILAAWGISGITASYGTLPFGGNFGPAFLASFIVVGSLVSFPVLVRSARKDFVNKTISMVPANMAEEVKNRILSFFASQLPEEQQSELKQFVESIIAEYSKKKGFMGGDEVGKIVAACNKREDKWKDVYDYIGLITGSAFGCYSTFLYEITKQPVTQQEVSKFYQEMHEKLQDLEKSMGDLSRILPR